MWYETSRERDVFQNYRQPQESLQACVSDHPKTAVALSMLAKDPKMGLLTDQASKFERQILQQPLVCVVHIV
jgi:hypothetical protein